VKSGLHIAIMGTRGLPPRYGGRETAADEIGRRLASRGHDVLVYSRRSNSEMPRPSEHRGIRLVHLPSVRTKSLDTPTHVALSVAHLIFREKASVVLLSGSGTAFAIPFLRLFGRKSVLWVDGKAWTRGKWGRLARGFLRRSAEYGVRASDAMVTDTPPAHEFYLKEMGRDTTYIPYGANAAPASGTGALDRLGLTPGRYVLFVGRLIPEKGVHYLIEAFEKLPTDHRLVIVGEDPYEHDYVQSLKSTQDERIQFPGYVFGEGFHQLMRHCRVYVQPSDVEGTSPVLLTAMAQGRPVVVNGIPENRATIGDAGLWFPPGDVEALRAILADVLEDEPRLAELGRQAADRARAHFDWERITDSFEDLLGQLGAPSLLRPRVL